jgi:uncharacterized membrane protein (DUF485 family)
MAVEYTDYEYVPAGTVDVSELEPLDQETSNLMKNEFSTGFKLTLFYYLFILAIPVLNWFAPDFMFSRMWGGMSFAWFFTSIVAMAMAFTIAFIHTYLYKKQVKTFQENISTISTSAERRNI